MGDRIYRFQFSNVNLFFGGFQRIFIYFGFEVLLWLVVVACVCARVHAVAFDERLHKMNEIQPSKNWFGCLTCVIIEAFC